MALQDGMSNEALMARYQEQLDAAAFEQLVGRFLTPGLAAARQILRDEMLAEDAVQETFLRIVRSRKQYRPAMRFSTWFYTILRNVCTDMLRRQARQLRLLDSVATEIDTHVRRPSLDPLEVSELLAGLPDEARAVLVLRVVHDLPFRDIAAALGISEEAAKKRAQRALRRLREQSCVRELLPGSAGGNGPSNSAAQRPGG
ncbi:MAG TPA: sigma-70 family RNA polymerase sigma factor [Planctomycetaceae bacterium]|nr:sigma-70 family RNA polymerase sigma factor [Planctomycetaceae bacterium]